LFEDEDLRQRSPLIGLGQWEAVLLGEGFENVLVFPRDSQMQIRTDAGTGPSVSRPPGPRGATRGTHGLFQHATDARVARTIRTLREIQQLGSQVMVVSADVADRDQMERVFAAALERFSGLHGVVHTAGVLGQGLMHHKTEAEAAAVLAPKVRGTAMLAARLREHGIELDFWFLCSALRPSHRLSAKSITVPPMPSRTPSPPPVGTLTISINWGVAGTGHDRTG
jgi:NAD(P)-dependent dehydrogenase (short-subunit alcohol dehydrogenase family)